MAGHQVTVLAGAELETVTAPAQRAGGAPRFDGGLADVLERGKERRPHCSSSGAENGWWMVRLPSGFRMTAHPGGRSCPRKCLARRKASNEVTPDGACPFAQ